MRYPLALAWIRVRTLLKKELRQLFRDVKMRLVIFGAPVIQLLLFGYAATTDVYGVKTFVVDHDQTLEARALQDALIAGGYFRIIGHSTRPGDLTSALDGGHAAVGLEIPAGFAADLTSGRGASVQVVVDGSHSNTGTIAQGYAVRAIQDFAVERARQGQGGARQAGVDLRVRAWFNPGLESRVYNIPAVIGILILFMSLLLTALSIVRERELGTIEQLTVSPLRPGELILGKSLPILLVTFAGLIMTLVVGVLWFEIPFRGSITLLLLASVIYSLVGIGIGLFISTISRTQQEAFMGIFLIFLPSAMLADFLYPIHSMPLFFQYFTLINPARYYIEVVRAIFLKGAGVGELWPQLAALTALALVVFWAAVRRFGRTFGS